MKYFLSSLFVLSMLLTGCASAQAGASSAVIETGIDPETWAIIPAGEFLSGQHEHLIQVDYAYEMMVTPVTNAQFARFLNEALASGTIKREAEGIFGAYPGDVFHGIKHEVEIRAGDYLLLPLDKADLRLAFDGTAFQPLSGYENHPAVMVTWFGARAYCQFNGWRLPTEIEWEKAARGTDNRPFPWGESIDGRYANFYGSRDPLEEGVGKLGDTNPVGYYNGQTYAGFETLDAASPYGLYDMAGNVWQWTADVYEGQHYRYLRGGSKADYGYNLRVWTRNSAAPDYFSPNAGLRCARNAGE
jgi:formylglycine-generating enzyme required for sulfatase activity